MKLRHDVPRCPLVHDTAFATQGEVNLHKDVFSGEESQVSTLAASIVFTAYITESKGSRRQSMRLSNFFSSSLLSVARSPHELSIVTNNLTLSSRVVLRGLLRCTMCRWSERAGSASNELDVAWPDFSSLAARTGPALMLSRGRHIGIRWHTLGISEGTDIQEQRGPW